MLRQLQAALAGSLVRLEVERLLLARERILSQLAAPLSARRMGQGQAESGVSRFPRAGCGSNGRHAARPQRLFRGTFLFVGMQGGASEEKQDKEKKDTDKGTPDPKKDEKTRPPPGEFTLGMEESPKGAPFRSRVARVPVGNRAGGLDRRIPQVCSEIAI